MPFVRCVIVNNLLNAGSAIYWTYNNLEQIASVYEERVWEG